MYMYIYTYMCTYRKGLPEMTAVDLTITQRAKAISRFQRAATKVGIINRCVCLCLCLIHTYQYVYT